MSPSISYNSPRIYNLIHEYVSHVKTRNPIIAELVGRERDVFELACGTAGIAQYLHNSCTYRGWDLNRKFVSHGRKKGLDIRLMDIFRFDAYPESDVILILDVLHHIVPDHEMLLQEAKKRCRKLIVAEPYTTAPIVMMDFGQLNEMTGLRKSIYTLLNNIFGDNDGINPGDAVFGWNHDEQSLKDFFLDNGAEKIIKSGVSLIAEFTSA